MLLVLARKEGLVFMNSPSSVILFCLIWTSLIAPTSSLTTKSKHHETHQQTNQNSSIQNRSNGITGPVSWKHTNTHNHRALRFVHGTVNIIGWGVLLPMGAIMGRYFKKVSNDWYSLHIITQLSGSLIGALGWGLGISLKNGAKHHPMTTHGVVGTIIFAFATLQLLAICFEADEEEGWRKYWVIYHQLVGYALIALIVANIFQGMSNQNAAKKWEWFYGSMLGVLGMSVIALEVLRWRYAI